MKVFLSTTEIGLHCIDIIPSVSFQLDVRVIISVISSVTQSILSVLNIVTSLLRFVLKMLYDEKLENQCSRGKNTLILKW